MASVLIGVAPMRLSKSMKIVAKRRVLSFMFVVNDGLQFSDWCMAEKRY
jgi:hypothetical protein